jgi:hypothetical protein
MNEQLLSLSISELDVQLARHRELEKLCALRLERVSSEMREAFAQRDEFDKLLQLLREDLGRVEDQRRLWTQRWQEWLDGGGAIQRGRSFTQRHAELGELQCVLVHHQSEIGDERAKLMQRIDTVRAEQNRLQRQRDALRDKCHQLQRAIEARREASQDEMSMELAMARWHGARVDLLTSEGAAA